MPPASLTTLMVQLLARPYSRAPSLAWVTLASWYHIRGTQPPLHHVSGREIRLLTSCAFSVQVSFAE